MNSTWRWAVAMALTAATTGSCGPGGADSSAADEARALLADPPLESPVTCLAMVPGAPSTLYAGTLGGGMFKTANGGGNWNPAGLAGVHVTAVAVDPLIPTTLFAARGDNQGVYKSVDGGATWNPSGLAGDPGYLHTIVISPRANAETPATLYVGTGNGFVYRSADGGDSWSGSLPAGSNDYPEVRALAIDPLIPTTIYAGMQFLPFFDGDWNYLGRVLKSEDGGASWASLGSVPYEIILSLVIAPRAGAAQPRTVFAGGAFGKVFRIAGDGTWTSAPIIDSAPVLAVDPLTPTTLYAGTFVAGVLKSTDNGANWSATGLQDGDASVLVIDPSDPDVVYAGTQVGVRKSADGGATWNPTGALDWLRISAVSLNPTSVFGGATSTGTATLSQAAPAGGLIVHLSSEASAVASVPSTVTVPAGSSTVNFTVTTQSLHPTDRLVTIGAGAGGVGRSAMLTVKPTDLAPDTAITSAVDRQGVPISNGGTSRSTKITLHFTGTDDVGVAGFECSLDGSGFQACTSPVTYQGFSKGPHTFRVRAVDGRGFRDASPAAITWTRN